MSTGPASPRPDRRGRIRDSYLTSLRSWCPLRAALLCILSLCASAAAEGPLRSIIVFGNAKTERKTILNIINVEPRTMVDRRLLTMVDDRLANSGLFKSFKVVPRDNPDGTTDIRITVEEKQLWFVFPIVQAWSGRYSFGGAFGESNLVFSNARTIVAFQAGNQLNRFFYAIDAKNINQSDWSLRSWVQAKEDNIPLYDDGSSTQEGSIGTREFAASVGPGYQWTNEIRTTYTLEYRFIDFGSSPLVDLADTKGHDVVMSFDFTYDSLKRRNGFIIGNLIKAGYDFSEPRFGSTYTYHSESAEWVRGDKYWDFLNHVFYLKGDIGNDLPFHRQITLGGESLRGFREKQFRGDTKIYLRNDLLFQLFKMKWFTVFGSAFHDMGFLYFDKEGIDDRSFNNGVGGGLRMSLSSILAPVFGLDFGYGIENQAWETIFALGLVNF